MPFFAVGACKRDPKMIKIFITGVPIVIFLMAIPGIILSTGDGKVFMAWYLQNKDEYKDWGANCSEAWVDEFKRFLTIASIMNWASYIIGAAIAAHLVLSRRHDGLVDVGGDGEEEAVLGVAGSDVGAVVVALADVGGRFEDNVALGPRAVVAGEAILTEGGKHLGLEIDRFVALDDLDLQAFAEGNGGGKKG